MHNATVGKWTAGLLVVVLFCLPIFLSRSSHPSLLADSDTAVLLHHVRERQAPLSWFGGDWPLENHFYRPVSTLFFEMDNALYGTNPAGYGLTNALLCIGCVLLLFWFLRELTDKIEIALPGAALFAMWHGSFGPTLSTWATLASWLVLVLVLLPGRSLGRVLLGCLTSLFVAGELAGMQPLEMRMVDWLPGRTASVMTLFAVASLGCYARYERLGAERRAAPTPGPLDPPATKGTVLRTTATRGTALWAVGSVITLALCLGAYEQGVMVPTLLAGTALCLCIQRYRVRWAWQAAFWGVLAGYLVLRAQLVPSEVSGYQAQQFRSGPGVWTSLLDYLFPAATPAWQTFKAFDVSMMWEAAGVAGIVTAFPWPAILRIATNLGAILAARKDWLFPLAGLGFSFAAFLPMAWLKHFDHYHYLPMAMRAFFAAAMMGVTGKAIVSAASRRALPAPARLDPAPGSLPRR